VLFGIHSICLFVSWAKKKEQETDNETLGVCLAFNDWFGRGEFGRFVAGVVLIV